MTKNLYYSIFIFLLLYSTTTYAQGFKAGVLAGINASQVSGDSYSGFDKAGLLLGLYSNFDVSEKVKLQFEINYSQKGSRKNPKTSEGDHESFLLRLNYIEIPLMARFQHKSFSFEGGAYYGRLVKEYMEDEDGAHPIPEQFNQFKENDIGVLVGINYNFTEHIIMNWRFSNSIIPIREYDSGESYLYFNRGAYHTYLSFNLRYTFIKN